LIIYKKIKESNLPTYQNLIKKNIDEIDFEDIENYFNVIKSKTKLSIEEKNSITNTNNNRLNNKTSHSLEINIKENLNDSSNFKNNYNSNSIPLNRNETNKTRDSSDINNAVNKNDKKISICSPFDNSPKLNSNYNKNRQSLTNNSLTINNDYVIQNNINGNEDMEYFKKTFEYDQQIFRLNKANKKPLEEFSKELVKITIYYKKLIFFQRNWIFLILLVPRGMF